MRRSIVKIASLALLTPLAGATLFATTPAAAAPATAPAAAGADEPFSVFKVTVAARKKVKAGGQILYSIRARNTGPHLADAYFIGGRLPKGIVDKVHYSGPKGTKCEWDRTGFWCWGDWTLEVGETDWLKIQVKLKKKTKGVAVAKLGAISYDVPTGAEGLSKEELDRIGGIKGWIFTKTAKSRIIR
jgi:hypothetical protein